MQVIQLCNENLTLIIVWVLELRRTVKNLRNSRKSFPVPLEDLNKNFCNPHNPLDASDNTDEYIVTAKEWNF